MDRVQVDSDEIAPLTSVNQTAAKKAQSLLGCRSQDGPLAQVVEQLAFNQRVAGSSPARLTLNLTFRATEMVAFSFVYSFIYRFLDIYAILKYCFGRSFAGHALVRRSGFSRKS